MRTKSELEKLVFEFPERLEKYVLKKGISPYEFNKRLGLSFGRTEAWIEGVAKPDMLRIMMLANALDISTDELLGLAIKPPYNGPHGEYYDD